MSFIWIALLAGMAGSLHCAGMCGPLVLAMPLGRGNASIWADTLLYHGARITAYALIGALFGLFGAGLGLAGFQQTVSIVAGIFMLLFFAGLILPRLKTHFKIPMLEKAETHLIKLSSRLLKGNQTPVKTAGLGFLNGLLPCGLVYMAIAGALAQQDTAKGAIFMALFGLGTFPAMAAISILKTRVNLRGNAVFRYASPLMVLLLGVLFVVRGMNLGVPYLSPKISEQNGQTQMECCTKPNSNK